MSETEDPRSAILNRVWRFPQDFHVPTFRYRIAAALIGYRVTLVVDGRVQRCSEWFPTLRAVHHGRDRVKGPWASYD